MNTSKFENVEKALDTSKQRLVALKEETRTRATTLAHDLEKGGQKLAHDLEKGGQKLAHDLEKGGQKGLNTLIDVSQQAIHAAADVAGRFPALEAQATKLRDEANRLEKAKKTESDLLAISDYETLGVKDILPLLDELSLDQLREIEGFERAHKARKTVLSSVERAIEKKN